MPLIMSGMIAANIQRMEAERRRREEAEKAEQEQKKKRQEYIDQPTYYKW